MTFRTFLKKAVFGPRPDPLESGQNPCGKGSGGPRLPSAAAASAKPAKASAAAMLAAAEAAEAAERTLLVV